MNPAEKEIKLRAFAASVINHSEYREEIDYLLKALELTVEQAIQSYVNYDMNIFSYENEIYESLSMRMTLHLHYLLPESWHQDRQLAVLEAIKKINPSTTVDMGFGAPTRYIREFILLNKKVLLLTDLYPSAFIFSQALFNFLSKNWKSFFSFKQLDMNEHPYPGDFDLYIFQDSIEHVRDSTEYLNELVKKSPSSSKFIFSLPIGPRIPLHTISWDAEQDAITWLEKANLQIIDKKRVFVNPEVDLFADQFEKKFYNLIVSCQKNPP